MLTRVRFLLAFELGGLGMMWYTVKEEVKWERKGGEGGGRSEGENGGKEVRKKEWKCRG